MTEQECEQMLATPPTGLKYPFMIGRESKFSLIRNSDDVLFLKCYRFMPGEPYTVADYWGDKKTLTREQFIRLLDRCVCLMEIYNCDLFISQYDSEKKFQEQSTLEEKAWKAREGLNSIKVTTTVWHKIEL